MLELMVPDMYDISSFVQSWIGAASDVSGQSAKIVVELEDLESQDHLRNLISQAARGISDSRKSLTALGPSPSLPDVQNILQDVSWFQFSCCVCGVRVCLYLCMPFRIDHALCILRFFPGKQVCGGLQET